MPIRCSPDRPIVGPSARSSRAPPRRKLRLQAGDPPGVGRLRFRSGPSTAAYDRRDGSEEAGGAFSFLVPVYDGAHRIGRTWATVRRTGEVMAEGGVVGSWEAVFVDDGSTGGTRDLLDDLAVSDEHLRVFRHDANRDVGTAMRTGLAAARGDLVLYTDAELPIELGLVPSLVEELRVSGADLLSAVRRGLREESTAGAVRSWLYSALVRLVFHLPVHDVNFACKLATRRVLAPARWHSDNAPS